MTMESGAPGRGVVLSTRLTWWVTLLVNLAGTGDSADSFDGGGWHDMDYRLELSRKTKLLLISSIWQIFEVTG